jgi:hypothetical protein
MIRTSTAVLADATNLGLTRMADACSVASYRQLAWTTGWHLREETYRRALATLVKLLRYSCQPNQVYHSVGDDLRKRVAFPAAMT